MFDVDGRDGRVQVSLRRRKQSKAGQKQSQNLVAKKERGKCDHFMAECTTT